MIAAAPRGPCGAVCIVQPLVACALLQRQHRHHRQVPQTKRLLKGQSVSETCERLNDSGMSGIYETILKASSRLML